MDEEKRTSPRIATNVEIVFREADSLIRSYMLNVSNGGIFVKTDHPLPLDTVLSVHMQLPNDKLKMDIECQVVWTNKSSKAFPAGMGLQFTKVAPEHQKKITAFVDANRAKIKARAIL